MLQIFMVLARAGVGWGCKWGMVYGSGCEILFFRPAEKAGKSRQAWRYGQAGRGSPGSSFNWTSAGLPIFSHSSEFCVWGINPVADIREGGKQAPPPSRGASLLGREQEYEHTSLPLLNKALLNMLLSWLYFIGPDCVRCQCFWPGKNLVPGFNSTKDHVSALGEVWRLMEERRGGCSPVLQVTTPDSIQKLRSWHLLE